MSCYVLGGGRRKGLPNRCCDRAQRCSRRLLPRGATGARQGLPAAHRRCLAGPVQCARPAARGSADGRSGGRGGGGGLVLSGLIVDNLSYEWIFWFGLIVVLVAMVATHLFVPESPVKSPARIDWTGAALLSAGLVCMLLAVSQGNDWGWDSARIVGQIAAAIIANNVASGRAYPAEEGYTEAFLISTAALCLALLAAFLIPGRGAGAAAPGDVAEAPARG